MAQRHQFKKGFIKLQRLGPIKFGEQSRWKLRAPESVGMWAFPYPHFDLFYAYHKYTDLAPKELRGRYPKNPKWYTKHWEDEEPLEAIEFCEVEIFGRKEMRPFFRDENGELQQSCLRGTFYEAREKWVENVGKKILPMRTFWYSGLIYTHFNHDGSIGASTSIANDENNDWTLMSTEALSRHMSRNGIQSFEGAYYGDGKPRAFTFGKDHLEVFIPRGKGIIRDKL